MEKAKNFIPGTSLLRKHNKNESTYSVEINFNFKETRKQIFYYTRKITYYL